MKSPARRVRLLVQLRDYGRKHAGESDAVRRDLNPHVVSPKANDRFPGAGE